MPSVTKRARMRAVSRRGRLESANRSSKLQVPSIFITGERDSTRLWMPAEGTVIADCGHWVQQERPDEVNAVLLEFLQRGR